MPNQNAIKHACNNPTAYKCLKVRKTPKIVFQDEEYKMGTI